MLLDLVQQFLQEILVTHLLGTLCLCQQREDSSHINSLFPCWGEQGRCDQLNPVLSQDIAALQSVPANSPRTIPLLRKGGFQAAFRSPRRLLLHSLALCRNMGLGEKKHHRDSPRPAAPTARGCPGCSGETPQPGAVLGLPRELRVAAPGEEARWGLTNLLLPWLSQKAESRMVQTGSTAPWGTAATPMPIQGSPQTERTAPHQLSCCRAGDPSPSTLPSPGNPRHRSPPCCHSGDPGEPSPHPAGAQLGCEGGTGRPQPRLLINRC